MQENPRQFEDPDATLASPRFDAHDAQRAHPVVPLDEVRERKATRNRIASHARRPWLLTLVVVSLLAVVAVAGIATKVLRRAHTPDAAPSTDAAAQQVVTPVQQTGPPSKQTDASAQQAGTPAQKVERAARAGAQTTPEPAQTSAGTTQAEAQTSAREEARARRAQRVARDARDARAVRDEETTARVEASHDDGDDSWGEGRRGRGWRHRRRDGDDEGWRRDSRRDGRKQPRLVDVLTGRP